MTEPLRPGATIGILGCGQLGRMLSVAAGRLGYRTHVYDPAADGPAAQLAHRATTAAYDDAAALDAFATDVDLVTFEFENIPVAALEAVGARRSIRPGIRALEISQDRLAEKRFLDGLGLATAPYAPVDSRADLRAALAQIGTPAILKTRRLGYDGKGQARIDSAADAEAALDAIAAAPAILEGFVPFRFEASVIAARGLTGEVVCYDPGRNDHADGILRRTTVPAPLDTARRTDAALLAGQVLNALEYTGVMGIELFVTPGGLVVNEIAPRVHNSGHWTQQGCAIDQFEQHIRAITGWPLGNGARHCDVEMENLVGSDIDRLAEIAHEPGAAIHLYGKTAARPGRKMGHVNRIRPR